MTVLKKISVRVPEELLEALKVVAERAGLSMSEGFVEAVLAYLDRSHARPPDFPTLDERRAANRERLRQTALMRWRKP